MVNSVIAVATQVNTITKSKQKKLYNSCNYFNCDQDHHNDHNYNNYKGNNNNNYENDGHDYDHTQDHNECNCNNDKKKSNMPTSILILNQGLTTVTMTSFKTDGL